MRRTVEDRHSDEVVGTAVGKCSSTLESAMEVGPTPMDLSEEDLRRLGPGSG